MAHLMDYCQDDSMLFSDVYQDHVPGMTVEFPTPKAFRVGSYSGSDCERKFQTFPTPPDSPVLAELTPPNTHTTKQPGSQSVSGFSQTKHQGSFFTNEDCSVSSSSSPLAQPAEMDLTMLMEDLLHGNMSDQINQQFCENSYQSNVGLCSQDALHKSDFLDNLGQFSPNSPINLSSSMFTSSFSDTLDDCQIPSPAPSPITVCDIDIFAGDLPNLDDLTLVSEFAQMESTHNPRSQHGAFGMSSSGEDSDIESVVSGYSLPIDEIQPSTTYNSLSSSVLSHPPPPLYHEHHHNIQQYHQYRHSHHHQSQSPYPQHHNFGANAANGRTHNYQCRTLHTTLKMLDSHADGVVTQEMSSQQGSCAGPIRKPCRARPRKQSVTSSDDGGSDEDNVVTTTTVTSGSGSSPNRNRGRGRREAMKGNHLWEFIRDLLKSDSYCPKFIRWEDRESGVFRFVNSEAVANMWGRKKNNPQMTYEKLSRAMRYYYKREILERVDGRRLVYKFGKNAEGWKEAAGLQ